MAWGWGDPPTLAFNIQDFQLSFWVEPQELPSATASPRPPIKSACPQGSSLRNPDSFVGCYPTWLKWRARLRSAAVFLSVFEFPPKQTASGFSSGCGTSSGMTCCLHLTQEAAFKDPCPRLKLPSLQSNKEHCTPRQVLSAVLGTQPGDARSSA